MCTEPLLHLLPVMDAQIVHNEEDLLLRVFYQSLHEPNEELLRHIVPVAHETTYTLIIDRGNHIDLLDLRERRNGGGILTWSGHLSMIIPCISFSILML